MKKIFVICPVYNESKTLNHFYNEFIKHTKGIRNYNINLIFSNNCSTDDSLNKIKKFKQKNDKIQYLTLSRNFGYQKSVLASLETFEADAYIIIDCDCEDPPALIPSFIRGFEEGFDLVYGKRERREEPKYITLLRKSFYRLTHLFADNQFILDMAEFSLVSKRIRDVAIKNNTSFPFIRSEFAYAGFSKKAIPYDRQKRSFGKSNYNLFGMTKFAVAGFLTTTTFPLRFIFYFFIFVTFLNFLLLFFENTLSNIFKIFIFINLFYFSISLSFLGMYIARIYNNSLSRQNFVIDYKNSSIGMN